MIKHLKLASNVLLLSVASVAAQAGIIAPDGNEWELRGSFTDFVGHTIEAASDTGWTWASQDDWLASGLDSGLLFFPSDLEAFEGPCGRAAGLRLLCNGYLSSLYSDTLAHGVFQVLGVADREGFAFYDFDQFFCSLVREGACRRELRVSFRDPAASVPEPAPLALLGLGLLGMGMARRRVKH